MSVREACVLSEELARRLADVEPRPDIVLGIANGGLLVADVVARSLALPLKSMKIQRRGSGVKKALTRVPGARRLLAWLYDHTILHRPMAWLLLRSEKLKAPTETRQPGDASFQGKVVAVVDDCIESGQTIAVGRGGVPFVDPVGRRSAATEARGRRRPRCPCLSGRPHLSVVDQQSALG